MALAKAQKARGCGLPREGPEIAREPDKPLHGHASALQRATLWHPTTGPGRMGGAPLAQRPQTRRQLSRHSSITDQSTTSPDRTASACQSGSAKALGS